MKRPEPVQTTGTTNPLTADTAGAAKYPTLVEYLTCLTYDDGTSRETSTVSLFIEDGKWKVAVNDRDLRRSAYVTGDTLQGVLSLAEKGLANHTLDWRLWASQKKKK